MILNSDAKFKEKLISCFKNDKNLVNFDLSTRNSPNFYFDWFLLSKVYNVWPKKSTQDLSFKTLKSDAKFEEKLIFGLENDMRNMANIYQSTWKISELGLWWDSFIQRRKCMSLKFTEELCVMSIKNDAKFEEGLTCRFKIHMRNLTNFDPSTRKSQKCALKWITFEQSI